jgi:hypothetical protein
MSRILRLACGGMVVLVSFSRIASGQQFSEWSAPVNLGPVVNSPGGDFFPVVSRDGLSLYFTAPSCPETPIPGCRPGYGGWDIFVAQRASVSDPWGPAQNVGPTINTAADEGAPTLSVDGHLMFFSSTRLGGFGGNDIYVSRRHNKRDDFAWQAAENLGAGVNSAANEASPQIFEDDETGIITLYFDSNRLGGPGPFASNPGNNGNDIYASVLQPDGTFGPAAPVAELNTTSFERQVTIRRDGRELFFVSNRPGSAGGLDLWVSTRATTADPWSTPQNLGPTINSTGNDAGPALSFDGTTLYFQSDRVGGLGAYDLYVVTRTKIKGSDRPDDR